MADVDGVGMTGKGTRPVHDGCHCRPCCHGNYAIREAYVAVLIEASKTYAGL